MAGYRALGYKDLEEWESARRSRGRKEEWEDGKAEESKQTTQD